MSDKQELNMEEMGQVAGGWTFHSNGNTTHGSTGMKSNARIAGTQARMS